MWGERKELGENWGVERMPYMFSPISTTGERKGGKGRKGKERKERKEMERGRGK